MRLAYFLPDEFERHYARELVAVHASFVTRVQELRARARALPAELTINGARMAVVDGDAATEEDVIDALSEHEETECWGKAAQVFLGGDGRGIVRVELN